MTTTTGKECMTAATTRNALAAYLEEQARWRRQKAEEYPDDPRNGQWASRLEDLAGWVRTLPAADPRLIQLDRVWGLYGHDIFDATGVESSRFVSRPHVGAAQGDEWLHGFVDVYTEEEMESADDVGNIDVILGWAQDPDPAVALPALRRLQYRLEAWEEEAVLKAQVEDMPWSRIGQLLGRSKQSVWEKHRDPGEQGLAP